jgi:hypothetical protein
MEVNMLDFCNFANKANDWNFPVEEKPLTVEGVGKVEGKKALVRTDNNTIVGVHSDNYKVLNHDDVVNAQYDAVKQANLSSDFEFKVTCLEGGKKLSIKVMFPDLTIEPMVGDIVNYEWNAFNSYDGMWAYQVEAQGNRLACKNGMVSPTMLNRIWAKHTSSINVVGTAEHMLKSVEVFKNHRDEWKLYNKTRCDSGRVEDFFKSNVVNYGKTLKTVDEGFNKKQLSALVNHYGDYSKSLGNTKWAVYNALTHWSTHCEDTAVPEITSRYRQDRVVKAMRSKAWDNIDKHRFAA